MAKGFEFELSNGTILKVVPNDGADTCAISHGDTKVEIDVKSASFCVSAPAGKLTASIPTVVRFGAKEFVVSDCVTGSAVGDAPHIMRTCMPCNGTSCCVTNCCGDCGCGWICD